MKMKNASARGEMGTMCQGKGGREQVRRLATFGLGHCQLESVQPLLLTIPPPLAYLKSSTEAREEQCAYGYIWSQIAIALSAQCSADGAKLGKVNAMLEGKVMDVTCGG